MDTNDIFNKAIARARDCSFKTQSDEDLYADAFVDGALWMREMMKDKKKRDI